MPQMLICLSFQGAAKLVFKERAVFFTDKDVFLRPLLNGSLPFDDIRTRKKI